ncbi:MAG: diaminopimelate decarboxylase [Magnetovibrio sp.]|nr:diaminopimelate decarboxylase [Magnetovibrio sp.]
MENFQYNKGKLFIEGVSLIDIIEAVGTPFYCYSAAAIKQNYKTFKRALKNLDAEIFFSLKANSNVGVLATLARLGAGADIVSAGELTRALIAGFPPNKIVFSGVGKSRDELSQALSVGIKQFNVESESEMDLLSEIAKRRQIRAPVSIRVNPNVDARTHSKITTGTNENKFGVTMDDAKRLYAKGSKMNGVDTVGVAVHIGSQLTQLAPYRRAYKKISELVTFLKNEGYKVEGIDLGGGLGISYLDEIPPTPCEYGLMVEDVVGDLGCSIGFEPGRVIVGNAGLLVSQVIYVKEGNYRPFLIVDAAMNDLLRPALYDAYHEILPIKEAGLNISSVRYDVVGPICETSDTFGIDRTLPKMEEGDFIAFSNAGAYGAVMASTYNSRPLIPEVIVDGARFAIVAQKVCIEEFIKREKLPPWLEMQDEDMEANPG